MNALTIPEHWLIDGEVPSGTLGYVIATLYASQHPTTNASGCLEICIETDRPLRSGAIDVLSERGGDGALRIEMRGEADVVATATPLAHDLGAVALPAARADDLLSYVGGMPGPAAMFEARPLPYLLEHTGRADAWVRPKARTAPGWFALMGLDAWAPPQIVAQARSLLYGLSEQPFHRPAARRIELRIDRSILDLPRQWMLRASEHAVSDRGVQREHTILADEAGCRLASCVAVRIPVTMWH